jgi:hypothetical protein
MDRRGNRTAVDSGRAVNGRGFASDGQLALIAGVMRRLGYTGRDDRLDRLEGLIGRQLDSMTELTAPEAGRILARARRSGALVTRYGKDRSA